MEKRTKKIGTTIVVILLSILLLWWLFAATLINEDESFENMDTTEQAQ